MIGDTVRKELWAAWAVAAVLTAGAAEYQDAWGPEVGTALPSIAAADQHGELRGFDDLKGERGLLLFMVRSADW